MALALSLRAFGSQCLFAWLRQAMAGGRDRAPGIGSDP